MSTNDKPAILSADRLTRYRAMVDGFEPHAAREPALAAVAALLGHIDALTAGEVDKEALGNKLRESIAVIGDKSRTFFFAPDATPAPELEDGEVVTDLVITASPEDAAMLIERLAGRLRVAIGEGDSAQVHLGPGRGDWRIFTKGAEDDATVEEVARGEAGALAAHPLAPIVGEVLALGQRHDPDAGCSPDDYMQTIHEIASGIDRRGTLKSPRDKFLMIAAVALAGAEAHEERKVT